MTHTNPAYAQYKRVTFLEDQLDAERTKLTKLVTSLSPEAMDAYLAQVAEFEEERNARQLHLEAQRDTP